jgi:hypothetical protein
MTLEPTLCVPRRGAYGLSVDLASEYAALVTDGEREDKPIVVPAMETLGKVAVDVFVPFGGAAVVIWEALRGYFGNRVEQTVEEVLAEVAPDALASKMAESSEFDDVHRRPAILSRSKDRDGCIWALPDRSGVLISRARAAGNLGGVHCIVISRRAERSWSKRATARCASMGTSMWWLIGRMGC